MPTRGSAEVWLNKRAFLYLAAIYHGDVTFCGRREVTLLSTAHDETDFNQLEPFCTLYSLCRFNYSILTSALWALQKYTCLFSIVTKAFLCAVHCKHSGYMDCTHGTFNI